MIRSVLIFGYILIVLLISGLAHSQIGESDSGADGTTKWKAEAAANKVSPR